MLPNRAENPMIGAQEFLRRAMEYLSPLGYGTHTVGNFTADSTDRGLLVFKKPSDPTFGKTGVGLDFKGTLYSIGVTEPGGRHHTLLKGVIYEYDPQGNYPHLTFGWRYSPNSAENGLLFRVKVMVAENIGWTYGDPKPGRAYMFGDQFIIEDKIEDPDYYRGVGAEASPLERAVPIQKYLELRAPFPERIGLESRTTRVESLVGRVLPWQIDYAQKGEEIILQSGIREFPAALRQAQGI